MSQSVAPTLGVPSADHALHPPAISLRHELPWVLFGQSLLLLLYVVAVAPGSSLHEWLHDGRHLLGFPCH